MPTESLHPIRFPAQSEVDQDAERFEVEVDGQWRELRCHDYPEIYEIPGLYEQLFRDRLACTSPQVVVGLLSETLAEHDAVAGDLRVLDLGAGNGLVGEELRAAGVPTLVGADLLPQAAAAARRDRADVYDDYLVCDMTDLADDERAALEAREFNALVTVAAIGFDDLPMEAFVTAYNLVAEDGWIAFNVKEDFLDAGDSTGYGRLVERMQADELLETHTQRRYRHRLSVTGEELHYVGLVASKRGDVTGEWLDEVGLNATSAAADAASAASAPA
jgi:predicted TPR repeat methyltransferase